MSSPVSRRLAETTAPEVCDAVYGPRLARDFPASFAHLCDVNEAHLVMLSGCGLLEASAASQLAQALRRIEAEGAIAVPLDPALEDAYFNFEAHLMRVAGAHVGGSLHMARSRNDILATMDRLRLRAFLLDIVDRLCAARESALQGARARAHVVMPGYTHLQPAQPITYGFYLLAVADMLGRDIERLRQVEHEIDLCPLGAGALAGTGFPIDRMRTAQLLGFAAPVASTLDAVASRDYALQLASALAVWSTNASRIAQDYYVWCTAEFDLVEFPDSVAGTSSIMPQKKNPVVLEYLKGKAGQIAGNLMAALGTVRAVNFTHTGDGNRETMRAVHEAAEESLRIAAMQHLVIRTAQPKEARMALRAQRDFGTATDLADLLVKRCGLSFRESHHVVGAVVRAALADGLSAAEVTAAMVDAAATEHLGHGLDLTDRVVRESLDPATSVAARVAGGPAPEGVLARCGQCLHELAQVREANRARREGFADARAALKQAVAALVD